MGSCLCRCEERRLRRVPLRPQAYKGPPRVGETVLFLVTRVIDGDTFEGHYLTRRGDPMYVCVRTSGINAPEKRTVAGRLVAEVVRRLIEGMIIRVRLLSWGTYRGRVIGCASYADRLLGRGLAKPYSGDGRKPKWSDAELAAVERILIPTRT